MGFESLSIAASGMFVSQRAIETVSDNVSNANTNGYSRQSVTIVNAPPTPAIGGAGMIGGGAMVSGLVRMRDVLADLAWRAQASTSGQTQARSDMLTQAGQVLGDMSSGAPAALDSFWSAWNQLSMTPGDTSARNAVLSAGTNIAGQLNQISNGFNGIIGNVRSQVSSQVTQVNSLLQHVAALNQSIADAVNSGQTPSDLLDERDRTLDQLAQTAGTTVRQQSNGEVDVYLGSQAVVRGTSPVQLGTTTAPNPVGVTLPSGAPATVGGQLQGYITAANTDIPGFLTQLNAIAVSIRDAVNGVQQAGFDQNGNPGQPYFVGTDAASLAVNPALTPAGIAASSSGAATDGNNALAMSNLRNQVQTPGGQTLTDALNGFMGIVGQATSAATQQATTAASVLQGTTTLRAQTESVNTDEEMVDMLRYQRAYDAAAKAVSVTDQLMQTLIDTIS